MKKILVTVLAVVLAFALVACSTAPAASESPAESSAAASESAAVESADATESASESAATGTQIVGGDHASLKDLNTDFTIITIPKTTGLAWFQRMDEGVKQFAADTGVDAYQDGPAEADAAQQAQYVEEAIAAGVNAICVVPNDPSALEPVLQRAREAGIVVISHEADGMANVDYDLEAFDNVKYGEHFMQKLAELMGDKGQYAMMVGYLTSASHNTWVDASIAYQEANYPDMKLALDKIESAEDQEQAYNKTKEALTADPTITGMQGSSMSDPAGMAKAVDEMGLAGKVHIVGTSLVSVSGKYVRDGVIDMISFWDPAAAGYAMNELALKILNGQTVEAGMALTVPGYESLTMGGKNNNTLYGQAWIDVDKSNVDDPQYNF
ncbi:MAG: autoinducer 2 ABC transporter substrate-binding protein [Christensenella sp.]|nr:autoinducer 2 ABC transporter substrate-binding protein [Christensenella sp.]